MQQSLFERLKSEKIETEFFEAIPVNQIIAPDDAIEPDDDLVDDVREHGVIEPLLLRPHSGGQGRATRYRIVSGRRRYLAAVKTDKPTVPALITRISNAQESVLTMRLHKLRAENFIADIRAYERLLAQQLSEKEIGDLTGLKPQEIDRRKRLVTADQRIIKAVLDGRAKISVAEAAAKLPPTQQQKLMDGIEKDGGKLTSNHIAEIKTAQSAKAIKAIPQELFEPVPPAEAPPADIERFASEMWAILGELEATGCLKLERPKTSQLATNARIGATALIERIRATIEQPQAEFSEVEAERLRQEALARWRREPVAPVQSEDEPESDDPAETSDYAERGANASGVFENAEVGARFKFKTAYMEIRVAQDQKDHLWRTGYDVRTGNSGSSCLPRVAWEGSATADEALESEISRRIECLNADLNRETNQAEKARIAGLIKVIEKRNRRN